MNALRAIDLNLLVVLEALLDEAHVTRAAQRLGLSQPAASNALDRLRHLFADPLLERGQGAMRLTPAAEALRRPLRTALDEVRSVVDVKGRDIATAHQTVRLVMADAPAAALAAMLHTHLARTAPKVTLSILPWRGADDAVAQLMRGESDLIASMLPPLDAPLRQTRLLDEHYVVAMRRNHPASKRFNLTRWLAYPHVVVSGRGLTTTPLDTVLAARGLSRRIGVVVPSFLMVAPLLAGSDLIAMLPSRCLPADWATTLATRPPPLPIEGFHIDVSWHDRRSDDPVVQHVARAMIGAFAPKRVAPRRR